MNREIKFRAWDYTRSKMMLDVHNRIDFCEILRMPQFYAIMQYTGISDKEGKDIYEGDIVAKIRPQGMDKIKIIKWHNAYVATGFNISKLTETRKIIGNIFQNPEKIP